MIRLIGIAGGIGSGKSVVSRILRLKGYEVYDCDTRAKMLMADSAEIKRRIRDEISAEVTDGLRIPDRKMLAALVFSNNEKRLLLNEIVHGAVRDDLRQAMIDCLDDILFVEAAVMAESGLAEMCTEIWWIKTQSGDRLSRVMMRDNLDAESVQARIDAQSAELQLLERYSEKITEIFNDPSHSLIAQLNLRLS